MIRTSDLLSASGTPTGQARDASGPASRPTSTAPAGVASDRESLRALAEAGYFPMPEYLAMFGEDDSAAVLQTRASLASGSDCARTVAATSPAAVQTGVGGRPAFIRVV